MARGGEPWIKPRACKSTDCPAGDHAPALALPGEFHTKRRNGLIGRIERKNSKGELAARFADLWDLAHDKDGHIPPGDLWSILNRVIW